MDKKSNPASENGVKKASDEAIAGILTLMEEGKIAEGEVSPEEKKKIVENAFHAFEEHLQNGMAVLLREAGEELKMKSLELSPANFLPDPDKIRHAGDKEYLAKSMESGTSLWEIYGFREEAMIRFFEIGNYLLEKQRTQEAVDVFICLTSLAPYEVSFWHGLARAEIANQEMDAADAAYEMALQGDPENHNLYHEAIRQFYLSKQPEKVKKFIDLAKAWANSNPDKPGSRVLTQVLEENDYEYS